MTEGKAGSLQEREHEPHLREHPDERTAVASITCALCGLKMEVTSVASHMDIQHPAERTDWTAQN